MTLIDLISPSSPPQHGSTDLAVVFQHALAAAGDDAGVAPGGLDHQRAFAERPRFGLLAVDVLAAAAGLDHHDRVPVVGRGDVHGVDVVAGQQSRESRCRPGSRCSRTCSSTLPLGVVADVLRTSQTATYWTSPRPRNAPWSPRPMLPMPMPPITIRSLAGGRSSSPRADDVITYGSGDRGSGSPSTRRGV